MMNRLHTVVTRASALAIALGAVLAMPVTTHASEEPATPAPVELTQADVDSSNAKVRMAYGALVTMWTDEFQKLGVQFVAPGLERYRRPIRTSCGVMTPSNASYCFDDNTVYFDDVFVAAQAKRAARQLGTDGDMAAVGIIAHEMGHAAAMQLGFFPRDSYRSESVADCFAGAFASRAQTNGELEKGDLEEAFFGMASAGDPTPQPTGNARLDDRVRAVLVNNAHGTREQRTQNFRTGLQRGVSACVAMMQGRETTRRG